MDLSPNSLDHTRTLADDIASVQGFLLYDAGGGGTSSGLGRLFLERLSVDFNTTSTLSFMVWDCLTVQSRVAHQP